MDWKGSEGGEIFAHGHCPWIRPPPDTRGTVLRGLVGAPLPWIPSTGSEVMGPPALEDEQRPENVPVILYAAQMLAHQRSDRGPVKHAAGPHPIGRQHVREVCQRGDHGTRSRAAP